jgi:hypothetical protein
LLKRVPDWPEALDKIHRAGKIPPGTDPRQAILKNERWSDRTIQLRRMDIRSSAPMAAMLCIGGCLLFAAGWLLGGGLALTRGEPDRGLSTQTKGLQGDVVKLQKQVKALQSQQSRLADELDTAKGQTRDVRELKKSIEALKKDLQRVERDRIPNPLSGPAGAVRDAADRMRGVIDNVTGATPSPSPSPE